MSEALIAPHTLQGPGRRLWRRLQRHAPLHPRWMWWGHHPDLGVAAIVLIAVVGMTAMVQCATVGVHHPSPSFLRWASFLSLALLLATYISVMMCITWRGHARSALKADGWSPWEVLDEDDVVYLKKQIACAPHLLEATYQRWVASGRPLRRREKHLMIETLRMLRYHSYALEGSHFRTLQQPLIDSTYGQQGRAEHTEAVLTEVLADAPVVDAPRRRRM